MPIPAPEAPTRTGAADQEVGRPAPAVEAVGGQVDFLSAEVEVPRSDLADTVDQADQEADHHIRAIRHGCKGREDQVEAARADPAVQEAAATPLQGHGGHRASRAPAAGLRGRRTGTSGRRPVA